MEAKIKAKFSAIPAVKNTTKRFNVKIEDNKVLAYAIGMDKEVSTASIQFSIRHNNSLANETVADLKESFLNGFIYSIFAERFNNISQNPESPFISASASYTNNTRLYNSFGVQVNPKEGKQQASFKLAMSEINRALKFGFTNAEINRVLKMYKSSYENQLAKLKDRSHRQIIQIIQSNYLQNSNMTDLEKEYKIAKVLFKNITQKELQNQLQKLYTQKNRSVIGCWLWITYFGRRSQSDSSWFHFNWSFRGIGAFR